MSIVFRDLGVRSTSIPEYREGLRVLEGTVGFLRVRTTLTFSRSRDSKGVLPRRIKKWGIRPGEGKGAKLSS